MSGFLFVIEHQTTITVSDVAIEAVVVLVCMVLAVCVW